jgi:hypothetical protein
MRQICAKQQGAMRCAAGRREARRCADLVVLVHRGALGDEALHCGHVPLERRLRHQRHEVVLLRLHRPRPPQCYIIVNIASPALLKASLVSIEAALRFQNEPIR